MGEAYIGFSVLRHGTLVIEHDDEIISPIHPPKVPFLVRDGYGCCVCSCAVGLRG